MRKLINPIHWQVRPLPWVMCLIAAFFYMYEYWLRVTPSVLVEYFTHHYGLTLTQIGALSSAYYLAYTPMQLVVGSLIDRFGVRRLLTLAVIICGFGNFLFGQPSTLHLVHYGRILTGFGSAFAFVAY